MAGVVADGEFVVLDEVEDVVDDEHDVKFVVEREFSSLLYRSKHRLKVQINIGQPSPHLVQLFRQLYRSG